MNKAYKIFVGVFIFVLSLIFIQYGLNKIDNYTKVEITVKQTESASMDVLYTLNEGDNVQKLVKTP